MNLNKTIKQQMEECCQGCQSQNKPDCRTTCADIQAILRSIRD